MLTDIPNFLINLPINRANQLGRLLYKPLPLRNTNPRVTQREFLTKHTLLFSSLLFIFCGSHFLFSNLLISYFLPPSVTPRFSESLSVNHLSFNSWFFGFASPKRFKLWKIFSKARCFQNRDPAFFLFVFKKLLFSFVQPRGLFLIPQKLSFFFSFLDLRGCLF